MNQILNAALALLLLLAAGCVTTSPEATTPRDSMSICYVCQYNNDLACVCVKVKPTTPQAEYRGTTYYFCSDDRRTAFLKKPERYLSKH